MRSMGRVSGVAWDHGVPQHFTTTAEPNYSCKQHTRNQYPNIPQKNPEALVTVRRLASRN